MKTATRKTMPPMLVVLASLCLASCASPLLVEGASTSNPRQVQAEAGDGLYLDLGGETGIGRIAKGLVERLFADPRIAKFFEHSDKGGLSEILAEQFAHVSGGPKPYGGATMRKAHKDMGIGQADFNVLVEDLQDAMDEQGVPSRVQNRLLARLAPMQRDVVEGP